MADGKARVVCITQARMNSCRLAGKVMMDAAGKPLLQHHLERLMRARTLDAVVLATTVRPDDDAVADLGARLGVPVVRGSEPDVLDRYRQAAQAHGADVVVRVTADCPLIDPEIVDDLVTEYLTSDPRPDYATMDMAVYPLGLNAEVFSRDALETAWAEGRDPVEREHVTPFIYRHPDRFRLRLRREPLPDTAPPGPHRWCVDTAEDLELVRRMLEALVPAHPRFGWRDCFALLARHPDWPALNRGVKQLVVA